MEQGNQATLFHIMRFCAVPRIIPLLLSQKEQDEGDFPTFKQKKRKGGLLFHDTENIGNLSRILALFALPRCDNQRLWGENPHTPPYALQLHQRLDTLCQELPLYSLCAGKRISPSPTARGRIGKKSRYQIFKLKPLAPMETWGPFVCSQRCTFPHTGKQALSSVRYIRFLIYKYIRKQIDFYKQS